MPIAHFSQYWIDIGAAIQQPGGLPIFLAMCPQVFIKRGARQKTMPMWQLTELEGAMHLFEGVKKDRLHDLYRKWGGSIRWCLSNALLADNEAELTAGIDATDVSALQKAITGRAVVNQVCG